MRLRAAVLVWLLATVGCSDWLRGPAGGFESPDVPSFADPSRHAVPVAVPDAPAASAQTALLGHARAARHHGAAPQKAPVVPGEPPPIRRPEPEATPDPETLPTRDGPDDEAVLPEVPVTPEAEAALWLESAALVTPGCLLNDTVPALALPSPEALVSLLTTQPRGFAGVAREALVCLLRVPRAANAEVFGASAFLPSALSLRASLAGDERLLGVVAAVVATQEPAGQGVLVAALDERDDGWTVRETIYLPWAGGDATHKLHAISESRLLSKKRTSLSVKQRDRYLMTEHLVAFTTLDAFVELGRFTVLDETEGRSLRATVDAAGKGYPRAVDYRVLDASTTAQWRIERWATSAEHPYTLETKDEGPLNLDGAAELLLAGRAGDAAWVYDALAKEDRQSADALALGARIEAARSRHRKALQLWKKAADHPDAQASVFREYGQYLSGQKKKKDAVKALKTYLERAPEAADRTEVEDELRALGAKLPPAEAAPGPPP